MFQLPFKCKGLNPSHKRYRLSKRYKNKVHIPTANKKYILVLKISITLNTNNGQKMKDNFSKKMQLESKQASHS